MAAFLSRSLEASALGAGCEVGDATLDDLRPVEDVGRRIERDALAPDGYAVVAD
jgi:hypothetical protein